MNAVVAVCMALVAAGALAALRWGHLPMAAPTAEPPATVGQRLQRVLWYLLLHLYGAIAAGLLVVGPGGRLVMRLLAVTAGDAAQGKRTEADEIVGVTTIGGTIGFVLFVGLFGGFVLAAIFGLLRKWLPPGRWGALASGAIFAVVLSTRLEPLRPDNEDFGLVGPGWLAVTTLLAVGALAMLTMGAVVGRLSTVVPVLGPRPLAVLPYAPLVLLIAVGSVAVPLAVGVAVGIALLSWTAFREAWAKPIVVRAGQVVVAAATLAFLPAFVQDVGELL